VRERERERGGGGRERGGVCALTNSPAVIYVIYGRIILEIRPTRASELTPLDRLINNEGSVNDSGVRLRSATPLLSFSLAFSRREF
jgi:hypothetical protein